MPNQSVPLRFSAGTRAPGAPRIRDVKDWVREAAGASDETTVVVSELTCAEPGCPPVEVVMALLEPGQTPVQKRLHKPLVELSRDEVTQLWTTKGSPAPCDDHDHTARPRPLDEEV
jgi:hypothetical protein